MKVVRTSAVVDNFVSIGNKENPLILTLWWGILGWSYLQRSFKKLIQVCARNLSRT